MQVTQLDNFPSRALSTVHQVVPRAVKPRNAHEELQRDVKHSRNDVINYRSRVVILAGDDLETGRLPYCAQQHSLFLYALAHSLK